MDIQTNTLIAIGAIVTLGILLALIAQITWVIRILIASYIALSLIFLMPHYLFFNAYAQIIYFMGIVCVFILIERSRFFDMAHWSAKRFSFTNITLSLLTALFFIAIVCFLVPFAKLNAFVPKEIYNFLNEYIFYIAIVPLVFSFLFSNRLRAH